MAEMLSDNMEAERWQALAESEEGASPRNMEQRKVLPDMLSWLHCFSLYAAFVCSHRPNRARQMWAYQALMVSVARRCGGIASYYTMPPSINKLHQDNADFSRLNQSHNIPCLWG